LYLLPASASSQNALKQHLYFAGRLCAGYEGSANYSLAIDWNSIRQIMRDALARIEFAGEVRTVPFKKATGEA
jgi:hypothetical protein